jgi:putative ABC transport system substrate-binding protein
MTKAKAFWRKYGPSISVWLESLPRRDLIAVLAIGLALIPAFPVAAERSETPRIGVLVPSVPNSPLEQGLREGLRQLGYIEDKNITIEWHRYARSQDIHLFATDLARAQLDLIVTSGSPATHAVMRWKTTPVVFTAVGDPIGTGFASSLSNPGGLGTGVSTLSTELVAKRLEFLHQMVPRARRIAYFMNSSNPINARALEEAQTAARALGLRLLTVDIQEAAQIEAAFNAVFHDATEAVLIAADYVFLINKARIAEGIRKVKLPTMVPWSENLDDGLLMSYGPNLKEVMRRCAVYVDKVLKGANPGDLPIEQVSEYELIIDLRVARALDVKVPEPMLFRANKVIR